MVYSIACDCHGIKKYLWILLKSIVAGIIWMYKFSKKKKQLPSWKYFFFRCLFVSACGVSVYMEPHCLCLVTTNRRQTNALTIKFKISIVMLSSESFHFSECREDFIKKKKKKDHGTVHNIKSFITKVMTAYLNYLFLTNIWLWRKKICTIRFKRVFRSKK